MSAQPYLFNEFVESGFDDTQNPFLSPSGRRWSRHLTLKSSIIAAVGLLACFILSFFPSLFFLSRFILLFVYFLAGIPALIGSLRDLSNLEINIDILMTLAAFLSVLIGSEQEGALLLVLFALSGAIEDSVTMKAKATLSQLRTLAPTQVSCVNPDGSLTERFIQEVSKGAHILIKAGQIVPLDGIVIRGESSLNLVHLTGENLPVSKKVGDQAPAGARNLDGVLTLEVTHTSQESTLARLIDLICQAQEAKPRFQRWIDRFGPKYATSIIVAAAGFACFLPLFTSLPFLGFEGSLYRALAFLIAASPCALILALPIGYLSAVSSCARRGILLKGGVVLDALHTCHTIAFDKTGTLTTGALSCTSFLPLTPSSNLEHALSLAYALEKNALHPIAQAVVAFAKEKGILPATLSNFKSIAGHGLYGEENQVPVWITRPESITDRLPQVLQEQLLHAVEEAKTQGELVAALLIDTPSPELYLLRFEDTIRPTMPTLIARLYQSFRLVMLTGDHEVSAERVANQIGIKEFFARLTPEQKLQKVAEMANQEGLIMVGDGINDAPALSRATVGISMGKVGSSTAMDASDVVLLHDNLELLDWLVNKASQTRRVLFQNLVIALFAIVFATTPALLGWIPLWVAVVLHEGGTVLVGLNSLRLLR